MNSLVYVGGFGGIQSSADMVGQSLMECGNYENFDAFTFGFAYENPHIIAKAVIGADAFTHSAGMMPIMGSRPDSIHSFNPPLPLSRTRLLARSALMVHQAYRLRSPGPNEKQIPADDQRDRGQFVRQHAFPFLTGKVSKFNAIDAACEAQRAGINVGLAYTSEDILFHPTKEQLAYARSQGVLVAEISGVHDELVAHTKPAFKAYFAARTT